MKRILSSTAEKKWRQRFSHYKPMGFFQTFKGKLTPQSVVRAGRNSKLSELSCMSSLPASMKRIGWKTGKKKWRTPFSPLQPYGSFLLPWKPEFWSDLIQNQMQPSPQPNDASDKIWFAINPLVSEILMFESVNTRTDGRTHGRTPARLVCYKLPSEP